MIFSKYGKVIEKFVTDNSPAILTVVGVVGTATTAYLTGKASFKAGTELQEQKEFFDSIATNGNQRTKIDKAKIVWRYYIPAVSSGAITVAAIICAHKVSTRRMAALAAAYSLSERRIDEYKDKVQEKLGIKKEKEVKDELAQDKINRFPGNTHEVVILGDGKVPCFDLSSERYFQNTMEGIRQAQNDINQQVLINGYATLGDLYEVLNLKPTAYSEEIGWTPDNTLDIHITAVIPQGEKRPALAIDYDVKPIRGFK